MHRSMELPVPAEQPQRVELPEQPRSIRLISERAEREYDPSDWLAGLCPCRSMPGQPGHRYTHRYDDQSE
jgi:hypothetical protein